MNKSDEILFLYRQDEREAFRLLFDTYYGTMLLFANRILSDAEVAEDIVQECLLDFWANKRFLSLTGGLDKYIFQAVKHASLNELRNRNRRLKHHEEIRKENTSVVSGELQEEAGELEILYTAISRLPEERQKIFKMICVNGMKYREVADSLNISVNTVKTQMTRSLKFLRETLKDSSFSTILFLLVKKCIGVVAQNKTWGAYTRE